MDVNTDSLLIIFVHPWMGIFPETPQTLNTYTPRLFEVILEVWRLLKPELFEQVDAALCSEEKDLSIIKHGGGLSPSTATNQCYLVPLLSGWCVWSFWLRLHLWLICAVPSLPDAFTGIFDFLENKPFDWLICVTFSRRQANRTVITSPVAGECAGAAAGGTAGSISLLLVKVQRTSAKTEDGNFSATVKFTSKRRRRGSQTLCGPLSG